EETFGIAGRGSRGRPESREDRRRRSFPRDDGHDAGSREIAFAATAVGITTTRADDRRRDVEPLARDVALFALLTIDALLERRLSLVFARSLTSRGRHRAWSMAPSGRPRQRTAVFPMQRVRERQTALPARRAPIRFLSQWSSWPFDEPRFTVMSSMRPPNRI